MVLKSTPVVFIQLFVVFIFGEWPNINTLVAFFNTVFFLCFFFIVRHGHMLFKLQGMIGLALS